MDKIRVPKGVVFLYGVLLSVSGCMDPVLHQAMKLESNGYYLAAADSAISVLRVHPTNHRAKEMVQRDGQKVMDASVERVRKLNNIGSADSAVEQGKITQKFFSDAKSVNVDLVWPSELNESLKAAMDQAAEKNYSAAIDAVKSRKFRKAYDLLNECLKYDNNYKNAIQLQKSVVEHGRKVVYIPNVQGDRTVGNLVYSDITEMLATDPFLTIVNGTPSSSKKSPTSNLAQLDQAKRKNKKNTSSPPRELNKEGKTNLTNDSPSQDSLMVIKLSVISSKYEQGRIQQGSPQNAWTIRVDGKPGDQVTYYDCTGKATYSVEVSCEILRGNRQLFTYKYPGSTTDELDFSTCNCDYDNITNVNTYSNTTYTNSTSNAIQSFTNALGAVIYSTAGGDSYWKSRFHARKTFKTQSEISAPVIKDIAELIANAIQAFCESAE